MQLYCVSTFGARAKLDENVKYVMISLAFGQNAAKHGNKKIGK